MPTPPAFWFRPPGPAAWVLEPAARLYAWATRARLANHVPWRAAVPVVSVGNLVAGGAGKTPVALALAASLRALGRHPVFLTRGYGGRTRGPVMVDANRHDAAEVGDEPLLLAAAAPTVVARDRAKGIGLIEAARAGDVVILDDAHQNPALVKDLSLVVIDRRQGFGNGRVIPAGPLREPVVDGLARADGVVMLTVAGEAPADDPPLVLPDAVDRLDAVLVPVGGEGLAGRRVLGFAGIGRPQKFAATLATLGADVVGVVPFADHHRYRRRELDRLRQAAAEADALLVTTAKDRVRLPADIRDAVTVVDVAVRFADPAALDRRLRSLLEREP